ncbi:MAG: ribosome recycling factor [Gammaproteobacteria bacterium]|nr:ribosome recycling factor [Gammaproteobacteria bacterium]
MTVQDILADADKRMEKSLASLRDAFSKIRTGRAHTSLLDHLKVEYYGSEVPLNQVANVAVVDAHTLSITPWEKDMVPVIEKVVMSADMGLNPATAGTVIRVPLPALTEERRRELVRVVRQETEGARVAVRNIRRDALGTLKEEVRAKSISEDEEHRAGEAIQKLTDRHVAHIEELLRAKETELMEV